MADRTDELLTVGEVAQRLLLEPRTVREKLLTGKIRGKKTGARWVVVASDVDDYLESVQPEGAKAPEPRLVSDPRMVSAQDAHIAKLRESLVELGRHSGNLSDVHDYTRPMSDSGHELRLPDFNAAVWGGLEQHLAGTDTWAAWIEWQRAAMEMIAAETVVIGLARKTGESEFGIPLMESTPAAGAHLTRKFPGAVLAYMRVHRSLEDFDRHGPHIEWHPDQLYFQTFYLTQRLGCEEDEARIKFSNVLAHMFASKESRLLRDAIDRVSEIHDALEASIDGHELSYVLPGSCDYCPGPNS